MVKIESEIEITVWKVPVKESVPVHPSIRVVAYHNSGRMKHLLGD
jgi:hypothetical protein